MGSRPLAAALPRRCPTSRLRGSAVMLSFGCLIAVALCLLETYRPAIGSESLLVGKRALKATGMWAASAGGQLASWVLPVTPQLPGEPAGEPPMLVPVGKNVTEACSQALGVKKVALLFLISRHLAHGRAWHLWLWGAVGWLPRQALPGLQEAACGDGGTNLSRWERVRRDCGPLRHVSAEAQALIDPVLPPQLLYSIYVHTPPDFPGGLGPWSSYYPYLIPVHIRTQWGHISLIDAARALLAEALKDPLNDRFVLISETGVPLYNPLLFYQQLMHENNSRINACPGKPGSMSEERWRPEMQSFRLKRHHWRKSSQFFSAIRKHAELIVKDTAVYPRFAQRCVGWNKYTNSWQATCLPDEHYMPTLLAVENLENETYCGVWGVASVAWGWPDTAHPISYTAAQVNPDLMQKRRQWCFNETKLSEEAESMFVPLSRLLEASSQRRACQLARLVAEEGASSAYHPSHGCMLTARKFPISTAARMMDLFRGSCPQEAQPTAAGSSGADAAAAGVTARNDSNSNATTVDHVRHQQQQEQQQQQQRALGAAPHNHLNLLMGKACTPAAQQYVLRLLNVTALRELNAAQSVRSEALGGP